MVDPAPEETNTTPPTPTVIKANETKLALGDVSLETLSSSNTAVKSLVDEHEALKKEIEELKKTTDPLKEDSDKLKEIQEDERKVAVESLNKVTENFKDEDKFSEDAVKDMSIEEINRLLKVLNQNAPPPGTVKRVVSGQAGNSQEGKDEEWFNSHASNVDVYDEETGTYTREGE